MTKGNKSRKPMVEIENEELVKERFEVSASTLKLLADYSRFYSEHTGRKVSPDQVVDSHLRTLAKDPLFREWRKGAKPATEGQSKSEEKKDGNG